MRHDEMVLCGDGITRPLSQLQRGTHREAYPEQYAHPLVGKSVRRPDGSTGIVERVMGGSRFGPMAHLEGDDNVFYRVADLRPADRPEVT